MLISRLSVLCHMNVLGEKAASRQLVNYDVCVFLEETLEEGSSTYMVKLSTIWSVFIFIPQSTIKYLQQAFGVMTPLSLGVKYLFSPECIYIFMLFSNHYGCCKNVLNLIYGILRDPWNAG